MGYMHLSTKERRIIAAMRCGGYTIRQISTKIARSTSTVSREIKRNSQDKGQYDCCHAQDAYYKRRSKASRQLKNWSKRLLRHVSQKLHDSWSPEQISGRLKHTVSMDTPGQRCRWDVVQAFEESWQTVPPRLGKRQAREVQ
jgi:IS30 family transposase